MKIRIRDIHKGIMGAGVPIPGDVRKILEDHLGKSVDIDLLFKLIMDALFGIDRELTSSGNMILLRLGSYERTGFIHCWRLCFYDEVTDDIH